MTAGFAFIFGFIPCFHAPVIRCQRLEVEWDESVQVLPSADFPNGLERILRDFEVVGHFMKTAGGIHRHFAPHMDIERHINFTIGRVHESHIGGWGIIHSQTIGAGITRHPVFSIRYTDLALFCIRERCCVPIKENGTEGKQ